MNMLVTVTLLGFGCWTIQPSEIPVKKAQQDIPVLFEFQDLDQTETESANMLVVVRAGYAHDPIGKEGISKITAEMLRHGGKVQQRKKWLERLENIGIEEIDLLLGPELVQFTIPSSIQDLHLVGSIYEQMFGGTLWREGSLKKAKEILQHELDASHQIANQQEQNLGLGIFYNWIFEGHPYGHLPSGRISSVDRITLEDVQDFFYTNYIREASRIGVSLMMSNPKQKLKEEMIERISSGEDIPEVQQNLSQVFSPTLYNKITPKRLQNEGQSKPYFLAMKVKEAVPNTFESYFFMGQTIDISSQDKDFLAILLAMFIINDAPQLSGNIAMINQSRKQQKGKMILGVQPKYEGEIFADVLRFDALQQGLVWFFPEDIQNKTSLTSTVETYINNWETLIAIGVSKEEFLVYRNQLVQRIQKASAHQRLQWRIQLDALVLDSSLEHLERQIQNIQYQDVNDAIQRHISKEHMKSMLLIPSKLENTQMTDQKDDETDSPQNSGFFDTILNDSNVTTLNEEQEKQENLSEEIKEEEIKSKEEQIEEPFILESPNMTSEDLQSFDIKPQESASENEIPEQNDEHLKLTELEDLNFTFDETVIYFRSTYIEGVLQ